MNDELHHFFWFVMFFLALKEFMEPWSISLTRIEGQKTRASVLILAFLEKAIMVMVMYFAASQLTPWF